MNKKRICIYGASGFLGTALIEKLYEKYDCHITAVARNESGLVKLKERFPQVNIISGDIADPWVVKKTMRGMDEVYLLAAMKHVGLAEVDVKTCINTNVVGCMNIINESLESKPKVLMFISSDKAAQPTGVYGCSKKIAERLMCEAEKANPDTKYRTVRYGNILYSSGSVLCKWRDKMLAGEEIIVTDRNATRFFWSIEQALDLIFECLEVATNADPFTPQMKSISIGDLVDSMMEKYGVSPVKVIGLQVGENLHEVIVAGGVDSFNSERYTKEEILKLI
jgi:UDP-N-acetylglucosamine 4,6-dehydratase